MSYSKAHQEYYFGMTSKKGKQLEEYFGSSKIVDGWPDKSKVILEEYGRKSECRLTELLLQLHYRFDDRCVNKMFNIRVHADHVERIDKQHEIEVYRNASALLELLELGCPYSVLGWKHSLLQLWEDIPHH